MHSILKLADEIPWIMAPASVIGVMIIVTFMMAVMHRMENILKIAMNRAVINISVIATVLHLNI